MPCPIPSEDHIDGIDQTNRELMSLFIQYQEMNDLLNDDAEQSAVYSDSDGEDDANSTILSATTTHTTPLRNEPVVLTMATPVPLAAFPAFIQKLNQSNLPHKAVEYFTALSQIMLQVGQILFPSTSNTNLTEKDLEDVCTLSRYLVSLLASTCQRVNDQVDNMAYILALAPFTVNPAPQDLWSNYKQMSELIIKHTQMPSRHERELFSLLVHVYDAYIYHPALISYPIAYHVQKVQTDLDALYHALLTLEENYKKWWKNMQELGDSYTKPTMRRILDSPTIVQQILEYEDVKHAAEAAVDDPNGPGLQPATRQVVETLRANAGRTQTSRISKKSEFRREHTV